MVPKPGEIKGWTSVVSLCAIAVAGVAIAGYAGSGWYDVAASKPDNPVVSWILRTTMERSVRHHARQVEVPNLIAGKGTGLGFRRYDEMCVQCHGAPGILPGAIADGLNPKPVRLERTHGWNVAEIYWIIRYGVRMTGMAAFEGAHDDADLWATAAFVKQLPKVSPADYAAMRRGEKSLR